MPDETLRCGKCGAALALAPSGRLVPCPCEAPSDQTSSTTLPVFRPPERSVDPLQDEGPERISAALKRVLPSKP